MIRVDDAGAKLDGGDVSFARGAQAQDEAQLALGEPDWSGCGDDRGIEERGGFQRVFAGEKRADVELAGFGERAAAEDVRLSPARSGAARTAQIQVPLAEIRGDGGELLLDLGLAERERAPDDVDDARRVAGDERADEDPRAVRAAGRRRWGEGSGGAWLRAER